MDGVSEPGEAQQDGEGSPAQMASAENHELISDCCFNPRSLGGSLLHNTGELMWWFDRSQR